MIYDEDLYTMQYPMIMCVLPWNWTLLRILNFDMDLFEAGYTKEYIEQHSSTLDKTIAMANNEMRMFVIIAIL